MLRFVFLFFFSTFLLLLQSCVRDNMPNQVESTYNDSPLSSSTTYNSDSTQLSSSQIDESSSNFETSSEFSNSSSIFENSSSTTSSTIGVSSSAIISNPLSSASFSSSLEPSSSTAPSSSSISGGLANKTMAISINTSSFKPSCSYGSSNIIAVWVEKQDGTFIKTLKVNAKRRVQYLGTWRSATKKTITSSNVATIDGYSGATRSSFAPINISWDLKDQNNLLIPEGSYSLRMSGACKNTNDQILTKANFTLLSGKLNYSQSLDPASFNISSWNLQ